MNYFYNKIGQLVEDWEKVPVAEKQNYLNNGTKPTSNITVYKYNASGLVTEVDYNNKLKVAFFYNDKGYRTKKVSYNADGNQIKVTDYVLDVAGSTLAIYENQELVELPIYGASRLGVYKKPSSTSVYQLTDHLGNVRAVIAKDGNGNAAALVSATDYYPGGMVMPGRIIRNGQAYRYGYQGEFAETDPETGKVAFQLRLYDPRINRWLTTDPARQFHSPYMSMGNNWVSRVDPDGGYSPPTDFVNVETGETTHVDDGINQTLYISDGLFQKIKATDFGPDPRWFSPSYQNILFRAIGNDALQFGDDASKRFAANFHIYGEGLIYSQIDKLNPDYGDYGRTVNLFAENFESVDFALHLVRWREEILRPDNGGIANNDFEHQAATFLSGQRYGTWLGTNIANLNEVQNLRMDAANGNLWNAFLGRGGTAFEWKDIHNNMLGQALSLHYTWWKWRN